VYSLFIFVYKHVLILLLPEDTGSQLALPFPESGCNTEHRTLKLLHKLIQYSVE